MLPRIEPCDRCPGDVELTGSDREDGDDQLGSIAEGRVQNPADPWPRTLAQLLGGDADDPGESDQGQRGGDEEDRVGAAQEVDRPGGERQQHPTRQRPLLDAGQRSRHSTQAPIRWNFSRRIRRS